MRHIRKFNEELDPRSAARGLSAAIKSWGDRPRQIKRDIYTHLFRDYVGMDKGFMAKTRRDSLPQRFQLIEVTPGTLHENRVLRLYFWCEEGKVDPKVSGPFKENIKGFYMDYDPVEDQYIDSTDDEMVNGNMYQFNPQMVKFLIMAANRWRQTYYEYSPVRFSLGNDRNVMAGQVDREATEAAKVSKLTKAHFKTFANPPSDRLPVQESRRRP